MLVLSPMSKRSPMLAFSAMPGSGRMGSPRRACSTLLKARSGSAWRSTLVPWGRTMPGAAITAPGRAFSRAGRYFLSVMEQLCSRLATSGRETSAISTSPSPSSLASAICARSFSFMFAPCPRYPCAPCLVFLRWIIRLLRGGQSFAFSVQQSDGDRGGLGRVGRTACQHREGVPWRCWCGLRSLVGSFNLDVANAEAVFAVAQFCARVVCRHDFALFQDYGLEGALLAHADFKLAFRVGCQRGLGAFKHEHEVGDFDSAAPFFVGLLGDDV